MPKRVLRRFWSAVQQDEWLTQMVPMAAFAQPSGAYRPRMYVPCRLCGGPSTVGDGAGAPCRRCIRLAVAMVSDQFVGMTGVKAGRRATALLARPDQVPWVGALRTTSHARRAALPPAAPSLIERTVINAAVAHLPKTLADVLLLAALPAFALEQCIRGMARHGLSSAWTGQRGRATGANTQRQELVTSVVS